MEVKELTVSVGQTMQIGPYEPRNYHVSYKVELGENDDVKQITKDLRRVLSKEVDDYFKIEDGASPF